MITRFPAAIIMSKAFGITEKATGLDRMCIMNGVGCFYCLPLAPTLDQSESYIAIFPSGISS
jgi:hypothetical protein